MPPPSNSSALFSELQIAQFELQRRCLNDGYLWVSDLIQPLLASGCTCTRAVNANFQINSTDLRCDIARSLITSRQYAAAIAVFNNDPLPSAVQASSSISIMLDRTSKLPPSMIPTDPVCRFLLMYSRYLYGASIAKQSNVNNLMDFNAPVAINEELKNIRELFVTIERQDRLDPFEALLYGKVLHELDDDENALRYLIYSIRSFPCNYEAWRLVAKITSKMVTTDPNIRLKVDEQLPSDHWMIDIYHAQYCMDVNDHKSALEYLGEVTKWRCYACNVSLFERSLFIIGMIGMCYQSMHVLDKSFAAYQKIRKLHPGRLDFLDEMSNVMYVLEMRSDLGSLASDAMMIDATSAKSWFIVGNYNGLLEHREDAVSCFIQALKCDPYYISAWTLMGHEYIELKNAPSAVACYRRVIQSSPSDYRAWYGLGSLYELLGLRSFASYYYKSAYKLRPDDARMLNAVAQCLEAEGKVPEAISYYEKAYECGDSECISSSKLVKLYKEKEKQATHYRAILARCDATGGQSSDDALQALQFLGKYYVNASDWDSARQCFVRMSENFSASEALQSLHRLDEHSISMEEASISIDQPSMTN